MLERDQEIHFVKVKKIEHVYECYGVYEFREECKWHWLQKLCFKILDKIGAHRQETTHFYRRRKSQNDNLLKSLLGQEKQWLELVYNQRPRIYLGINEERELYKLSSFMGFDTPLKMTGSIELGMGRERPTWHHIPIYVVPWMKGAIIVPE
jgi:hypothetical protein